HHSISRSHEKHPARDGRPRRAHRSAVRLYFVHCVEFAVRIVRPEFHSILRCKSVDLRVSSADESDAWNRAGRGGARGSLARLKNRREPDLLSSRELPRAHAASRESVVSDSLIGRAAPHNSVQPEARALSRVGGWRWLATLRNVGLPDDRAVLIWI